MDTKAVAATATAHTATASETERRSTRLMNATRGDADWGGSGGGGGGGGWGSGKLKRGAIHVIFDSLSSSLMQCFKLHTADSLSAARATLRMICY